ncbi:GH15 family glucan-1,4-alpha-glucosidase [Microlunatus panaciterrae]|uniref:GH15 family glucan-1,4-alpha-glucosidase n=1 Tax=Microlunatus panaciterrae TaxID=400768 RepID=A0ABS2RFY7_9ACTN|nr:GH15 family glucan-1,4-alpha-glucosidase [Microlunatus panaciterrae]
MPLPIEDYALIGDCHTAALVGRDGSIDWLCLPRFDSPSIFGALLGGPEHGRWLLAPTDEMATSHRHYHPDTFILETVWETSTGVVTVTDVMPLHDRKAEIVRRVTGVAGTVELCQELVMRFDYSTSLPWVRRSHDAQGRECLIAAAGPNALVLRGGQLPRATDHVHRGVFEVSEGEQVDLSLMWYPSYREVPELPDVDAGIWATREWWQAWAANSDCPGPYEAEVVRSLLVLRALTHEDTGGIVAAATTSLPEQFGGSRNWDYRYSWLRDAALTLEALLSHGYRTEALNWRSWLLRAIAGDPQDIQIMYGVAGERLLPERELTWLPGYQGARPVRVGNGAVDQFQADVVGEVMVALDSARRSGIEEGEFSWPLQRALLGYVENNLHRRDSGIWEIRGQEQHFVHSRVMTWAALDRGVRAVQEHGFPGPADRWARLRDELRQEIEQRGFDSARGCYTQYYGSTGVDASLLQLPQVGFCAPDSERMLGTVKALEEELLQDGLLLRYRTEHNVDGLPPGEHPFLACSFWLVEQYARTDRVDDATELMDRLVGFANDVGLLSEEYDVKARRQAGNTPQALSHLALVRAADALAGTGRER